MPANRFQSWIALGAALTVAFLATAATMHWLNTPIPLAGADRKVTEASNDPSAMPDLTGLQSTRGEEQNVPLGYSSFRGHLNLDELTGAADQAESARPTPVQADPKENRFSVDDNFNRPKPRSRKLANRWPASELPAGQAVAIETSLDSDVQSLSKTVSKPFTNSDTESLSNTVSKPFTNSDTESLSNTVSKPFTNSDTESLSNSEFVVNRQPDTRPDDEFIFSPVPQFPPAEGAASNGSALPTELPSSQANTPPTSQDNRIIHADGAANRSFEAAAAVTESTKVWPTNYQVEVPPSPTPQSARAMTESSEAEFVARRVTEPLSAQPSLTAPNTTPPNLAEPNAAEPTQPTEPRFQPNTTSSAPVDPTAPTNPAAAPESDHTLPHVLVGSKNFKLAEQPQIGEHYRDDRPITDPRAHLIEPLKHDFSPGPSYDNLPYLSHDQRQVYEGKGLYAVQRPLVELGRPWYQLGQLSPGYDWFGKHNTIAPQFIVYGDYRSTVASNSINGDNRSLIASELNLDLDLKLTGTERFHAFISPLDDGVNNTRYLLDDDEFESELDANFDFGYFEGDLGAMAGGFMGETLPFDMPFAVGVMPLLFQNGVWMEDAFLGFATTLAAKNSPRLNISNMDITFFAGYDKISSDAFPGDDSAARMYGIATFIEAMNGYFEIDYAFLDDRSFADRSYHNFAFAYSRRYGRLISNSTRIIVNAGQSTAQGPNTADGVLLLSENSLISGAPSTLVPYFNFFAGFDRPQSAARAVQAGGVLRNTGILFESDGMTNYPTLDPTANDTYGGALGLNIIADDFSQQLVVELAMLGVMGEDATRNAPGEQLGIGFRYQLPLSNSVIFRTDGMIGFLNDQPDVRGLRFELRKKW